MPNLLRLILSGNKITTIKTKIFVGLNNLRYLSLNNNQITIIRSQAFVGLDNLQYLSLDNNQIRNIVNDSFTNLNNLQNLCLCGNKITYITADIFTNLNSLNSLGLSYNPILLININTFMNLNIKRLSLSNDQTLIIAFGALIGLNSSYESYFNKNDTPHEKEILLTKPSYPSSLLDVIRDVNKTYVILSKQLQDSETKFITKSKILSFKLEQNIKKKDDIILLDYVYNEEQIKLFQEEKIIFKIIRYLVNEIDRSKKSLIEKEALIILGNDKVERLIPNFPKFDDIDFVFSR